MEIVGSEIHANNEERKTVEMVFKFAKEFVRRFLEELRKKAERDID
jgi:hypothetical protein